MPDPNPNPGAAAPAPGHQAEWQGPTYHGRPALKPAPFNAWLVGGYIFLAGLSGASALLAAIADAAGAGRGVVRRGRYLALLAPTLGAGLLVADLHTPQRFHAMLRVAKGTSPMSIGTWLLLGFSACSGLAAALQRIGDRWPGLRWPRRAARAAAVPSAVAGAGMATYTAALLAATSTPLWAAAPRALGVRFAASSIASGAAALALGEGSRRTRRALDAIAVAALATELAAATAQRRTTRARGIAPAGEGAATAAAGGWDRAERAGLSGLGMALPLGLHAMALAGVGGARASRLAALATLAGSLLMRTATLGTGQASATRPGTAFRFAQPNNLPGASYIRKISPARRRYRA